MQHRNLLLINYLKSQLSIYRHFGRSDPLMDGGIVRDGYISPELQKLNPSPEDY